MELLKGEMYDPLPEESEMCLTQEQIKWRRTMMEAHRPRDLFFQEYPENDYDCFLKSGRPVFDQEILRALLARTREFKPIMKPLNERLKNLVRAGLNVYSEPHPSHTYVIGADTSSGEKNSDRSVLAVLDRTDSSQAAEWAGRLSPRAFAELAAEVAEVYGKALLAVERQNHGHAVLAALHHDIGYPRLYRHLDYDPVSGRPSSRKLGWDTNPRSRPVMIYDLVEAVERGYITVNSYGFVGECLTFVYLPNGKMGAQGSDVLEGGRSFDDRVIAWAIAWQVRSLQPHQKMTVHNETFHPTKYYLDWVSADEEKRRNAGW